MNLLESERIIDCDLEMGADNSNWSRLCNQVGQRKLIKIQSEKGYGEKKVKKARAIEMTSI